MKKLSFFPRLPSGNRPANQEARTSSIFNSVTSDYAALALGTLLRSRYTSSMQPVVPVKDGFRSRAGAAATVMVAQEHNGVSKSVSTDVRSGYVRVHSASPPRQAHHQHSFLALRRRAARACAVTRMRDVD